MIKLCRFCRRHFVPPANAGVIYDIRNMGMRIKTAYPLFLHKNNLTVYDFNSQIPYIIHLADPHHLVGGFQPFDNPL